MSDKDFQIYDLPVVYLKHGGKNGEIDVAISRLTRIVKKSGLQHKMVKSRYYTKRVRRR